MLAPLAAGVVFGGATTGLLRATGMDRDRATGPILLAAIALFYPVFAIEAGTGPEIALHIAIALAFLGVAVIGHARALPLVAAAMIGHGLFDISAHVASDGPAPRWWGPFCLGVDVVLGGWFLFARPWQRGA
ncbi:hypothetical protein [Jannaschia aquimarina]|uniref:Uncharacterized protein n=1 Tax=Jannaschia aquimarina TaxID=935700 RepID=A0A0D1EHG7_9RHOB|nr:hypothetical protein [Jannaschia aquimarina]KIT17124.1 hypothetical protein jaqu_11660 [Jannaschia aquimarina]SNS47374.1 hypothetical protein SAMN05421775_10187 [Jannaschia aquimarina]